MAKRQLKIKSFDACSGEPTVCNENSATVHLARCLLEDKGIDYTILHLNDPNCSGHMDKLTKMVTFSFNSSNACGTEVMVGTLLSSLNLYVE